MDTAAQDLNRLADAALLAPQPAGARWLVLRATLSWTSAIPWMRAWRLTGRRDTIRARRGARAS